MWVTSALLLLSSITFKVYGVVACLANSIMGLYVWRRDADSDGFFWMSVTAIFTFAIKMKTLFERARNIRHGCLESRLVARMETEGRELTDEETANELDYLAETIPYAGLGKEYEKEIMAAIRYLKKYY